MTVPFRNGVSCATADGHVLHCEVPAHTGERRSWVVQVDDSGDQERLGPAQVDDTQDAVCRMAIAWYENEYKRRGRGRG
jgi:hypothetical protein